MSLVQTAEVARKIIALTLILFVFYLLFLLFRPVVQGLYFAVFPPTNLPTVLFGAVEPLEFTEKQILNTANPPRFQLNTANGRLPSDIPDRMIVYKLRQPQFSYQAGPNAERDAQALGFTNEDLVTDLRGDLYTWRKRTTQNTLTINIQSKILSLRTDLAGKSNVYQTRPIQNNTAINRATNVLNNTNRFNDRYYKEGTQIVSLGKIEGNTIVDVQVPTQTQVARVDFFRSIENFPILGPDPTKGLINVTYGDIMPNFRDTNSDFIEIEYSSWEIIPTSESGLATYPIISVQDAWNAVSTQNLGVWANIQPVGTGIFNDYSPVRVDQVLIENIYLAYYDAPQVQPYLQPIYVFEGTYNVANRPGGDVTIYFPAVDGTYVKEPIRNPENAQQNL